MPQDVRTRSELDKQSTGPDFAACLQSKPIKEVLTSLSQGRSAGTERYEAAPPVLMRPPSDC